MHYILFTENQIHIYILNHLLCSLCVQVQKMKLVFILK
jgi:hypothetical protein